MDELFFYCMECNTKITTEKLGLLNEGKCISCGSMIGFSTVPKEQNDTFEHLTIVNDTEFFNDTM